MTTYLYKPTHRSEVPTATWDFTPCSYQPRHAGESTFVAMRPVSLVKVEA